MPAEYGNPMTPTNEASASAEYARRARAILFVGLSVAFIGSVLGVAFAFVPGSISNAELRLIGTCGLVSGILLLVLVMKPADRLPLIAAAASIFFAFYLAAGSLIAFSETGELVLMFPYLFWYFPLIAFNKFTNSGKSRRLVDYLIVASAVFVFAVYLTTVDIEHYALQLGAPSVFVLSFVSFALFLNLFAQYRERYVAEAERLQALERASALMRLNDERLQRLFDESGTGIGYLGTNGVIESCNKTFLAITRFDASLGRSFQEILQPEDREVWQEGFSALAERKVPSFVFEGRLVSNGAQPPILHANFVLMPASEFQSDAIMFISRDVTTQRAAEESLRQSQKIESLGQLTGGIAHDFNNLLTVILGNGEMLEHDQTISPRGRQLAQTIVTAAERGADLTKRLLAFARRQPLEPKVIDVNRLINGIEGLLRRTLNEDIDLEIAGAGGLWRAEIDPGQLEAALVNLAVNARDAMPEGGRLTIETSNAMLDDSYAEANNDVKPGQYVMISVTDTGTGMTRETLERAFEPFFTTKGSGRGSGLGLSMVFGFVKQSGGHAKIYSELGEGTSIKIYLPRSHAAGEAAYVPAGAAPESTGTGHILVVEDDELVRQNVLHQLADLGYHVTGAENGAKALHILKADESIDLLFTDVVMPGGMNGRQLAEAAAKLRPGLKVLFTSGYTENAIVHQGRLDRGVQLVSKPYRREELAAKIRKVLDA
ncbi:ATP-binding protein [Parvibaculum sp.]|uniref:ATP-binding protein n=1 Tax=Parvibaculum sp. TaxID=2024848 RepID=UPI003919B5F5